MDTYLLSREQKNEIIKSRRKLAHKSEHTKTSESAKSSPARESPQLVDPESNDSGFKLPFSKLKFGKRNATVPKNVGSVDSKRKKLADLDGSITLDSGEEVKISPMALAMGLDPRKNEAHLSKLKQALKRAEDHEHKTTEEKEEEKPVSKTLRRREAKHLPLEVDGMSSRPPGVPLGVMLPPPRKISLTKPVAKQPQQTEANQPNLTLKKSYTAPGPVISKAESDRIFKRSMSPNFDADLSDSSLPSSNATTPRELDSSSDSIGIPSPRIDLPARRAVQFDPISPASESPTFGSPIKPTVPTLIFSASYPIGSEPVTPRTRKRLSRPPIELTVAPNVLELAQEEYKRSSLPLDDKSTTDMVTSSVTKNFVELSTVQAADPVMLDPRGGIRVGRDSPIPRLDLSKSDEQLDTDHSNLDTKLLVSQMSKMLAKYENTLLQHEEGVEKRLQAEIKRREEAERKLGEKLEEIHIIKLEREIREANDKKQPEKPSLESLLDKEINRRLELERELRIKTEENERLAASLAALKQKHIALRDSQKDATSPVSEPKESKQKSDKKNGTLKYILESMRKLESDIRSGEELRYKVEEEKTKAIREREETQTIVKIVEANLKLKSFAIETIRQKLSQLLLDVSNNPKKMKGEKLRQEIISLQEEFVKLKTEFEVQMKWIAQSVSSEVLQKPLDLNMIPQSYRHLIANPSQVSGGLPIKPPRTTMTGSPLPGPGFREEDNSLATLKSLQDTLNNAILDDELDVDDLES